MPTEEKKDPAQQPGAEQHAEAAKADEQPNSKGWEAAKQKEAENSELRKKLAKLESDRKADEDAKLKEAGKWQDLATKSDSRSKELESALRRERIERAIVAAGKGAKDPEDLVNFVKIPDDLDLNDRDAIAKHFRGEVKRLKDEKPYLFTPEDVKDKNTTVSTAPAGGGKDGNFDPLKVKKSQVWGLTFEQRQKLIEHGTK